MRKGRGVKSGDGKMEENGGGGGGGGGRGGGAKKENKLQTLFAHETETLLLHLLQSVLYCQCMLSSIAYTFNGITPVFRLLSQKK